MSMVLGQDQYFTNQMHIKQDEGLRLSVYYDTEQIPTIGYGRNMLARPCRLDIGRDVSTRDGVITLDEAEKMFKYDYNAAYLLALHYFGSKVFTELSEARQGVLINMCFNLGTKINQFKKFQARINLGQYEAAAFQMLDSKWAVQVGPRATRLSLMMGTNKSYREVLNLLKFRMG